MPEGLIVKALSGYYYVLAHNQEQIQCRARGIFKKKGITPLVGDRVLYELTENGEGTVDEILPRSSELIRPPIANVNLAVLVFSLDEPALNIQLLDKFLVHTENAGLETIICFSKRDLVDDGGTLSEARKSNVSVEQIKQSYEQIGYQVVMTSAKTGEGTEEIIRRLAGNISVLAGQSGVGKSTLLNAIIPGLQLETNEISLKLGRGKHTTRHVELIPLGDGAFVADTPGFSQLDFLQIEAVQLSDCFKEFRNVSPGCKFRGCLHLHEPGCKVVQAVQDGEIAESRYKHYLAFLDEMKERKRRY
jgi:ribosome biogenesis GTPase